MLAAEQVGSNGRGAGGLLGYLKNLARRHPSLFAPLLSRVLPLEINQKTEQRTRVVYQTVEEARQAMLDRGFSQRTIDAIEESMKPPWPDPLLSKKDLQ